MQYDPTQHSPGYAIPQSAGPFVQAVWIALGGTFISGVYIGVKALWRKRQMIPKKK